MNLRPFWNYYGGKWRAAPHYPKPEHRVIVEPFAGAAGYALRHHTHMVILVEKHPLIAEMWRWLTRVTPAEVLAIPCVDAVDDLPEWVPGGARTLIGFRMNNATTHPCRTVSAGILRMRSRGWLSYSWSESARALVAAQVEHIRHWTVLEGDYTEAPDVAATWFVDPPYNNSAGKKYRHQPAAFAALGDWCRARQGQVLVCENDGADWLPFQPFRTLKSTMGRPGSREVLWRGEDA